MPKVVVAMSGGVDSSVSALLLQQAGYEVVGVFMRHGINTATNNADCGMRNAEAEDVVGRAGHAAVSQNSSRQGCCSVEDAADAARVAQHLGIPFYVLNFQDSFAGLVDHFVAEYAAGRTPNPCIRCNQDIKFGRLWEYAKVIGADWIATGHYARIVHNAECGTQNAHVNAKTPKRQNAEIGQKVGVDSQEFATDNQKSKIKNQKSLSTLLRGIDPKKDQSYVLFGLSRGVLEHVLFPVGGYHKTAIRQMAQEAHLTVSDKPDSYEICFVPDQNHTRLVRERRPQAFLPGDIVDTAGRRLGRHEGLPGYTIGQRHGLKIAAGEPMYVTELRAADNTLVVGRREELTRRELIAKEANWLVDTENVETSKRRNAEIGQTTKAQRPEAESEIRAQKTGTIGNRHSAFDNSSTQNSKFITHNYFRARCQIRYHHQAAPCRVTLLDSSRFRVEFDAPQAAVTPGQAAVLYDEETGQQVLGGGWIE